MTEEKDTVAEILQKLRDPFPPETIGMLAKPTRKDNPKGQCKECGGYHGLPAIHLRYVGHAALTDRLLNIDPYWNWKPLALDTQGLPQYDRYGGMWIWLTVCGVTRLGYGDAELRQGSTPTTVVKEIIGDSIRNAAMRFGCALEFWHKGKLPPPGWFDPSEHEPPRQEMQSTPETEEEPTAAPSVLDKLLDYVDLFTDKQLATFEKAMKEVVGPRMGLLNGVEEQRLKATINDMRSYLKEKESGQ